MLIMKTLLCILSLFLLVNSANAWRKDTVLSELKECSVVEVTKHNTFAIIKMECLYADDVVEWIAFKTLYISKKWFIIKRGK